MEIIIFRHGIALDYEKAQDIGLSDPERPLTKKGEQRTRAAAAGLRVALAGNIVNTMVSSTYLRARQTADILSDYLDQPPLLETHALAPDANVEDLDTWLHARSPQSRLIIVGHEPHLSRWASWSLTRKSDRILSLKKAGSCLIEFPGPAEGGTGTLRWLMTPTQLRALA